MPIDIPASGPPAAPAVSLPWPQPGSPRTPPVHDVVLEQILGAARSELGTASSSAFLIDLTTRRMAGFGADLPFSAASVIKVPLMVEVLKQVEAGQLSLDRTCEILRENWTESYEDVLKVGDRRTVSELVDLMIAKSDNVATNTLVDVVDRSRMNRTMADLDWPEIHLVRKLSGDTLVERHLPPGNHVTARSIAELFSAIAEGRLISPVASARMREWLLRNEDGTKIVAGLPAGTRAFHKTGEHSRATHDAGIFEVGGHTLVLSVLTTRGDSEAASRAIAAFTTRVLHALGLAPSRHPERTSP
jgi:beta-lactamase class A